MSEENDPSSSSVAVTSADPKAQIPQPPADREPTVPEEDDDADFVLVVNRKKHSDIHHSQHHHHGHHNFHNSKPQHHYNRHSHHHRGGQSSHYNDGGGSYVNNENDYSMTEGKRKKFRDRDNRDRDRRDNSDSRSRNYRSNRNNANRQRDRGDQRNNLDHHNHPFAQSNQNPSHAAATAPLSSLPSSSNNKENAGGADGITSNQNEKTAYSSHPTAPPAKTFSLVVAAGASSPPISSSSGCSSSAAPAVLMESNDQNHHTNSNNQQSLVNGQVTNRQFVIVVSGGGSSCGGGGSSIVGGSGSACTGSSSIADTASLSSESETIDSLTGGIGKSSCMMNETSSAASTTSSSAPPAVEYVDAPPPKVNPWVANRNAAQIITTTGSNSKKVPLSGFPSMTEAAATATPSDIQPKNQKSTSSQQQPQQPKQKNQRPEAGPAKQAGSGKPTGAPAGNQATPVNKPTLMSMNPTTSSSSTVPAMNHASSKPSSSVSSFAAVSSRGSQAPQASTYPAPSNSSSNSQPPSFSSKVAQSSKTSSIQGGAVAETPTVQPSSSDAAIVSAPQPYIREMATGFRPGRGRGSYSASARKAPSRSQVLMKVVSASTSSNVAPASVTTPTPSSTEDWPTLGEAVAKLSTATTATPAVSTAVVVQEPNKNLPVSTSTRLKSLSGSSEEETVQNQATKVVADTDAVDSHVVFQQKSHSAATRKEPQVSTGESASDGDQGGSSSHGSDNDDAHDDMDRMGSSNPNSARRSSKQKWVPLDLTAEDRQKASKGPKETVKKHGHHHTYPRVRGKENVMNGHADYSETERLTNRPSHGNNGRGMRGGRSGPSRGNGPRRHINLSGNHHRNNSNMILNGRVMNGHVDFDILSPTAQAPGAGEGFTDYPHDFTTLTPMYPAVSEFIMPYVTNGYFPTPFSPPAGLIVTDASVVAGDPHHQVTTTAGANPGPTVAVALMAAAAPAAVPPPPAFVPVPVNDLTMLAELVRQQIEYYFSEENLEKDFYLRRKMDDEGFLPVHLIATFPRVKSMTQEYSVVLSAIQSSDNLELNKDMTSVRTRNDPRKWPIQDSGNALPPHHVSVVINNNNNTFNTASSTTSCTDNNATAVPSLAVLSSKSASSVPSVSSASSTSSAIPQPVSSSSVSPSSSASSSPIKNEVLSQNSVNHNNNNHSSNLFHNQHDQYVAEPLNPNVPEFIPKSKVELY